MEIRALGAAEGDKLEGLVVLIASSGPCHPVDVLRYAIDELGHSQAELAELLGSRSSGILVRRRALTVDMVR